MRKIFLIVLRKYFYLFGTMYFKTMHRDCPMLRIYSLMIALYVPLTVWVASLHHKGVTIKINMHVDDFEVIDW